MRLLDIDLSSSLAARLWKSEPAFLLGSLLSERYGLRCSFGVKEDSFRVKSDNMRDALSHVDSACELLNRKTGKSMYVVVSDLPNVKDEFLVRLSSRKLG